MSHRTLRGLTFLAVLASAAVANPAPGQLVGRELGTPLWAGLLGLAGLAGLATVFAARGRWAYGAWAVLVLPLLGPVHDVATTGFWATAVGAVAATLHLELVSFEGRRSRWEALLDGGEGALDDYERVHRATWLRLAGALAVGLGALVAAYLGLLQVTPRTFADSLEARHVEGMAGVLLAAALLAAGVAGLAHRGTREGSA